jgi:hypothetical protein
VTLRLQKRPLDDVKALEKLVVSNAEVLEPEVRIIDARLVLGDATIDLVGVDPEGGLALIALGLVADGNMILRTLGAFSWAVDDPTAVKQRYPAAHIDASRVPRVMFIAERLPEVFRRQVRQLDVPAIDCVEVRHFDAGRTTAVSFEVVERIRRNGAAPLATPAAHEPAAVASAPTADVSATWRQFFPNA